MVTISFHCETCEKEQRELIIKHDDLKDVEFTVKTREKDYELVGFDVKVCPANAEYFKTLSDKEELLAKAKKILKERGEAQCPKCDRMIALPEIEGEEEDEDDEAEDEAEESDGLECRDCGANMTTIAEGDEANVLWCPKCGTVCMQSVDDDDEQAWTSVSP